MTSLETPKQVRLPPLSTILNSASFAPPAFPPGITSTPRKDTKSSFFSLDSLQLPIPIPLSIPTPTPSKFGLHSEDPFLSKQHPITPSKSKSLPSLPFLLATPLSIPPKALTTSDGSMRATNPNASMLSETSFQNMSNFSPILHRQRLQSTGSLKDDNKNNSNDNTSSNSTGKVSIKRNDSLSSISSTSTLADASEKENIENLPRKRKSSSDSEKTFAFISHTSTSFLSNEPSIDNAQLARRKRRRTSPTELKVLTEEFEKGDTPNRQRRQQIAQKVHMNEKAIQIWFQNKRQAIKRVQVQVQVQATLENQEEKNNFIPSRISTIETEEEFEGQLFKFKKDGTVVQQGKKRQRPVMKVNVRKALSDKTNLV
ncbi:Yox1 protein [Martiniozyma asiatica (nom. inval.)]|nr:Yox1 protein [Martiniozyma asiatica]